VETPRPFFISDAALRQAKQYRTTKKEDVMHRLEPQLSPNGLEALKLVRAIRALPEFEGTIRAERSALKNINTNDLKRIAVILAEEEEAYRE
jgi:hypothetical protein